ncbi:terminase small subunit [Rhizorhabdus wittichii]|uniref:terminase small subunit n=1 Tax=Rhizorhabdus wittichii TaxID=160791 RepID=UPI0002DBEC75|nr:terminase small subunit [Rhizorhabdus wittichii]
MPILPNAKYERFAQERASGKAPSDAYEAAGFKRNSGNAGRLDRQPAIQARVAELLTRAAEKVEISKARVLDELAKIGFSDIRKLFDDRGNLIPIHLLPADAAACLSAVEVRTLKTEDRDEAAVEQVAKIKTWDKRGALVDIAKIMGFYVEKHEHTGKDGGPIEVADMSEAEKARRIAFVLLKGAAQPPTSH